MRHPSLFLLLLSCFFVSPVSADQTDPGNDRVSYARDIAPILRRNCVSCHRTKQAEGGLSLETSKGIGAGGDSGELIVSDSPESSLLYARVIDDDDPMPPDDNTVGAKRLSQDERELLRTWIAQGATIDHESTDQGLQWQPIPETIRSSYSIAVSPDDRYVAIGHANRVELVNAKSGKVEQTLVDESLPQAGVADVDVVQAIAISPWGDRVATGGYRTVRIWKREPKEINVPDALLRAAGRVAVSPDRSAIAVVNAIGDIEVWDLNSNQRRSVISNAGSVAALLWRQADQLLVGYDQGNIRSYNTDDAALSLTLELDHAIESIDQSSDGRFIVSLGSDGTIRLFDGGQQVSPQTLAAIKDATSIAFCAPAALAIASPQGVVQIIDPVSDRVTGQFDHGAPIDAISVDASFQMIASGDRDGQVKLWKIEDASLLHTLIGDPQSRLRIAALERDVAREQAWVQTLVAKTDQLKKSLETEDAALAKVKEAREKAANELSEKTKQRDEAAKQITGTEQKIAEAKAQIESSNAAAVNAETLIAKTTEQMQAITAELEPLEKLSATAASEVAAAQASVDEAIRKLQAAKQASEKVAKQLADKKSQLAEVKKSNADAGEKLAASKLLATESTKQLESATAELTKQRESIVAVEKEVVTKQADLAERDQALVTAQKTRDQAADNVPRHQNTIRMQNNRLAELQSQQLTFTERRDRSAAIASIAFLPGDLSVAVVDMNGDVRTFDVASGRPLDRFEIPGWSTLATSVQSLLVDDETLVVHGRAGSPKAVCLRQQWTLERTIGGVDSDLISDRVTALDFRGDGASIAIGSGTPSRDGQVLVVATTNGEVLRRFDEVHSDSVLSVRFSPKGRILASASADKSIRLLDLQTNEVVGALDGHTHHVLSLAWKKDGRLIASGSADGTIKTWDTETGQQKRTIGGFPDEVTAVAFLGDSTQVISSCADGQVRIHETNNGSQVRAASASGDFLFTTGISPDSGRVYSAGQNGAVHVWEIEGLKSVGTW